MPAPPKGNHAARRPSLRSASGVSGGRGGAPCPLPGGNRLTSQGGFRFAGLHLITGDPVAGTLSPEAATNA